MSEAFPARPTRRAVLAAGAAPAIGTLLLPALFASSASAAGLTAKEEANVDVVNGFCAAWKTGDAAKAGTFLAEDAVVRFIASTDNSPAVSGRTAVVEQMRKYLTGTSIEFIVEQTFASGPMVMNRRVDRIVAQGKTRDLQIVGVFFVRGGQIKEWHDFDAGV